MTLNFFFTTSAKSSKKSFLIKVSNNKRRKKTKPAYKYFKALRFIDCLCFGPDLFGLVFKYHVPLIPPTDATNFAKRKLVTFWISKPINYFNSIRTAF